MFLHYQAVQDLINSIQAWGSVGERATALCCHLLELRCYKYDSQVKAGTSFSMHNASVLTRETAAFFFSIFYL